jgi:hypothetical protein
MEPAGSLQCSQEPATGHCPEPDESSPHLLTHFAKIHSNIIFPSVPKPSDQLPMEDIQCDSCALFPNTCIYSLLPVTVMPV